MAKCVRNGIPAYPTPERAVGAIKAMLEYVAYLENTRYGR
jgi:acyl-CoA synthetase (NDP forming)